MNKTEMIKKVAALSGEKQVTVKSVLAALDSVIETNAAVGEETGLGLLTIVTVDRLARTAKNPITGAPVAVPARKAVRVKVSKALKVAANGAK